ncbi:MAG TPA: BON domain-containing protein [Burkholderiaceae bacterium]
MKSDDQLQAQVIDELAWDPAVHHTDIGVAVRDGVVTLNGCVRSLAEKHAAEDAVRRVAGVKGLAVALEVDLLPASERSDSEIAFAANHALEWHALVPVDAVQVTVERGHVTLTGQVAWHYQRAAAERTVQRLVGVRGVTNQVHVKPPVARDRIEQGIHEALSRRADRSAQHVQVRVHGSRVTLSGSVHSWGERDAVCGAAWSAPGVTSVVDEMVVG